MEWLLEESARQAMQAAYTAGQLPTAAQQIEYEARDRSTDGVLAVAGSTAEIRVFGMLTPRPNFMAMLFGGGNTTYGQITAALADADADPDVKEITMAIDSPGGTIAGLFDTLAAMQAVSKPIKAVVHNVAASAAYALAAQADEIVAANQASTVGSIGILATFFVDENKVTLTSSDAPDKAPDVTTAKGKAAIVERLDALHEIFVDSIATGRKMDVETVNADFGRGATVLAGEALRRGMIDAIKGGGKVSDGAAQTGEAKMDINTFKAENPAEYEAIVQRGVDQERDRVTAHLIMGEKSGAMDTAVKAVREGDDMTATLQAEYMTAGMNRSNVDARQADDEDAGAGDNATAPVTPTETEAAATVLAVVQDNLGIEV